MRVHADDDLSFSGYRHLNDLRHDSAWITSCVLYAHSAICLVVVVAFASYGLVWPVKGKSETLLQKTTRKGTPTRFAIPVRTVMYKCSSELAFCHHVRSTVAAKPVSAGL